MSSTSEAEHEYTDSDSEAENSDAKPDESIATTSATTTKASVDTKPKPMFAHLKIEKKEEPLPIPFELPINYPKDVMEELSHNRLSGKARAKFIASVCSAIFTHKSLPTTPEYNHVAEQIVKKYPFLKAKSGLGHGYLVEAMRDKMKNIRNSKPRSMKSKAHLESLIPAAKKPKTSPCLPRFPVPPVLPKSEDDASYTRHLKRLQLEGKKPSPDKHVVTTLMDVTYPLRRHEILEKPKRIAEMLKIYPPLKNIEQIFKEFDRLFEKEMIQKIKEIWREKTPKIYEVAQNERTSNLQELCDDCSTCTSEECKAVYATMMLVNLLPDARTATATNTTKIVIFTNEFCDVTTEAKALEYPQPVVLIRGSASNPKDGYLVIENIVMSRIKVEELPIVLFAAYYVFNIEYTAGTRNFYQFLETIFLNVTVPKTKTRLNHLLNMLDNVV